MAFASIVTLSVAAANWAATVFVLGVTEKVQLAIVTGFFGFAASTVSAVLVYLTRREVKRGHIAAQEDRDRIEAKVNAPRRISTTRENGVRVESPDTQADPE